MDGSMPGLPVHHLLLELTQTHVHWVYDAIQPSSVIPFSSHLQSFPASGSFQMSPVLRVRWRKYWSFSFSMSPFNEYSGLISFRMDWLDFLAVQGTLKSFLQHHSSKASGFGAQLSLQSKFLSFLHPYMTTGKTKALSRWAFVGKVASLLFNKLSRLVKTFLPRSRHLLISWLQSPSAVILKPQNIVSHCLPIYLPWSDGTRCHDLSFLNVEF